MTFDISSMLKPEVYDHPVANIELIETHISCVILTGKFAYKIKKPVDFGFLNFSTLEKRHEYCLNELLLNRRLAPEIYLEVVAITAAADNPVINGCGETIEYAVKMAQFPQSAQLDNMLAAGKLDTSHMEAIARMVADFHQSIDIADNKSIYGNCDTVYQPVEENFSQIKEHLDTDRYNAVLDDLERWSKSSFEKLKPGIQQRKQDGFIRECHGDMHLRNLLWLNDSSNTEASGPRAFDCIEFNAQLRWIDVISEVAFLVMDLQDRQQHRLANRFLNTYLESTGDYAGLTLLRFYLCYRALVRAKVSALRLQQPNISAKEKDQTQKEFESYLALATGYTQDTPAKLIIMRGASASGKSTVSQQLVDATGLIRIRSDVERKRLFNVTGNAANEIDAGIYSSEASIKTYAKLKELALQVIKAGYSVIIDAAFLKYEQREPFQVLAESLGVRYHILEITAPEEVLRQRIIERKNDVSDADMDVLKHQLENWQPLSENETSSAIVVDTAIKTDFSTLADQINK